MIDTHGATALESQQKAVDTWNSKFANSAQATNPTSPATHESQPQRTGARPQFDESDMPIEIHRSHAIPEQNIIPQTKFESEYERLGLAS